MKRFWIALGLLLAALTPVHASFCDNDPVNKVDPLGLDAYMFGGTWIDDVDQSSKFYVESNIAALMELYTGERHYQPGVGTGKGAVDPLTGGAFGAGGQERLEAMYQDLVEAYNTPDKTGERRQIDLFGFSRGAALARAFANMIRERGIPLEGGGQVKGTDVKIRFLGAFDTVASFGWPGNDINPGKRLKLPDIVCSAAHAVSRHDVRDRFPVTLFADDPRVAQVWFAGVHADVGGAYETGRAQGYLPLYWMWMKAGEAGVPMASFPQDKYSAIIRYRMRHDLDWYQLWSDTPETITVEPYHDSATGVLYFGDRVRRWLRGLWGGDRYQRKIYVH